MSLQRINNEDMAAASPSIFDAQNDDVKTAIDVLSEEADARTGWSAELLSTAAKFLKNEVLDQ